MVKVLYFGIARELAGVAEELVDFDAGTVDEFWQLLVQKHSRLTEIEGMCRIALDMVYSSGNQAVSAGSEIAIIPPVSGG